MFKTGKEVGTSRKSMQEFYETSILTTNLTHVAGEITTTRRADKYLNGQTACGAGGHKADSYTHG